MFRRLLIRLVRVVKRDNAFDVAPEIPSGSLAGFIMQRSAMLIRGAILSVRSRRGAFPVFVGRHVGVTNARCLSLSPGVTIGDYCRLDCLGNPGIVMGRGVTLRRGVQIEVTSVLREMGQGCVLGDRVGVSEGVFIGAKGMVEIGEDTIVGPHTLIVAENHVVTRLDIPVREQGVTRKGIRIGRDCWIGAAATVLDGVSIHDHSVVGAGAVVTHDIETGSVVGGVPAREIGRRGVPDQE